MSSISHFMVQRRFADVARKREKPNERDVTDELIDYYLFIPLFIIDFCMMILGFGAFFLHYLYLQKHNTNLEYYAYLIIILTLVAHESILWFWRIRRNNAIGKIKAG